LAAIKTAWNRVPLSLTKRAIRSHVGTTAGTPLSSRVRTAMRGVEPLSAASAGDVVALGI